MDNRIDEYLKSLGDLAGKVGKKSIMPSELYFLYQFAKTYEKTSGKSIRLIIESGSFEGNCALRLRRLFGGAKIISVEKDKNRHSRLCKTYPNEGISWIHAANISHATVDKNTIVIIDGPKGEKAIEAAKHLYKDAAFVAIHDMAGYIGKLKRKFANMTHSGEDLPFKWQIDAGWEPYAKNGLYGGPLAIVWR